ncbi:MAG: 50S ribosomal protein L11 methyltransferase [Actinomycetota bacterium]|nr:50S ribosomal protein L11 methyltransferase [Actinomycetota bacterium]
MPRPGFSSRLKAVVRESLPPSLYHSLALAAHPRRAFFTFRSRRALQAITSNHGSRVQSGPFAGMKYEPPSYAIGISLPQLLGCYEAELHPLVEDVVRRRYEHIINVGSGAGYYAVGFALRLPNAEVHAFDWDPMARRLCQRTVELNGVADRVQVHGYCSPESLQDLVAAKTFVMVDCEGCELDLLRPDLAPRLEACDLLVELHEFLDPRISETILERFRPTHRIALIDTREERYEDMPALQGLSQSQRRMATQEYRSGSMQWAFMESNLGND